MKTAEAIRLLEDMVKTMKKGSVTMSSDGDYAKAVRQAIKAVKPLTAAEFDRQIAEGEKAMLAEEEAMTRKFKGEPANARCNVLMVVNPSEVEEVAQLFRVCDAKLLGVNLDTCTVDGYMPKATAARLLAWALAHPTTCIKINA